MHIIYALFTNILLLMVEWIIFFTCLISVVPNIRIFMIVIMVLFNSFLFFKNCKLRKLTGELIELIWSKIIRAYHFFIIIIIIFIILVE